MYTLLSSNSFIVCVSDRASDWQRKGNSCQTLKWGALDHVSYLNYNLCTDVQVLHTRVHQQAWTTQHATHVTQHNTQNLDICTCCLDRNTSHKIHNRFSKISVIVKTVAWLVQQTHTHRVLHKLLPNTRKLQRFSPLMQIPLGNR